MSQSQWITKCGKIAAFGFWKSTPAATGAYPLDAVTAVNSDPAIFRNGTQIPIGPAVWYSESKTTPLVFYKLECGGVERLSVVNGGQNYTNPSVSVVGGVGSGLVLDTPILETGVVGFEIVDPGEGYNQPPVVTISDPTGTGATAYAIVWGGFVSQIVVTNGGSNYTNPSISISGGSGNGSGAVAYATIVNGSISQIHVSHGGSGYTGGPGINVPGCPTTMGGPQGCTKPSFISSIYGADAGAKAGTLRAVIPTATNILGFGSKYDPTIAPTVSVGGGSGAQFSATIGTNGAITGFAVRTPWGNWAGSGYPANVQINIWDPTGTGAQVSYTVNGGVMWSPKIVNGGSGYTNPCFTIAPAGSTVTLRPIVATYIKEIPVISPGNYSTPPTIVVTDPTGTGAVVSPIMSGISPTDAVTFNVPANWATTQSKQAIAAVTGGQLDNWSGRMEGPSGPFNCFDQAPTLKAGVNMGAQPSNGYSLSYTAKNHLHTCGWSMSYGGGTLTKAADGSPVSWTKPGHSIVSTWLYGPYANNPIDSMGVPARMGDWSFQYTDPDINTPSASYVNVSANGGHAILSRKNLSGPNAGTYIPITIDPSDITMSNGNVAEIGMANTSFGTNWQAALVVISGGGGSNATAIAQVSGGTITGFTVICGGNNNYNSKPTIQVYGLGLSGTTVKGILNVQYLPNTTSWEIDINVSVAQAAGTWNLSDMWVVPPDAYTQAAMPYDINDPLATDDSVLKFLTAPNGKTVGCMRFMDVTQGWGGVSGYVNSSDLFPADSMTWQRGNKDNVHFQYARFFNTDPSSTMYSWCSNKVYGPQAFFSSGTDAFGNYALLPPTDNGRFMCYNNGNKSEYTCVVIEFRSTTPHNLVGCRPYQVWASNKSASIPVTNTSKPFTTNGLRGGMAWVTGPYTVAMACWIPDFINSGLTPNNTPQTVDSTQEIDLTAGGASSGWLIFFTEPTNCVPYEYPARMAAQLGDDTALWVNIPAVYSDELAYAIGQKTAEYSKTNTIYLEMGNEPWNGGFTFYNFPNYLNKLWSYTPAGTKVLPTFTSTGNPIQPGWIYGALIPYGANAFDQFEAGYVANGGNAANLKRIANVQWSWNLFAQCALNGMKSNNLPYDHLAVAPYYDQATDFPIAQACSPCGSIMGDAGGWSVDAINDLFRHWMAYSGSNQGCYQALAQAIQQSGMPVTLISYEGGADSTVPWNVPFRIQIQHDCFAHPSFADVVYGWYAACQQGCPAQANSGLSVANYYQMYQPGPAGSSMWILAYGTAQLPGPGTNNRYATIQGGPSPDAHDHNGGPQANVSTALHGLRTWLNGGVPPDTTPQGAKYLKRRMYPPTR